MIAPAGSVIVRDQPSLVRYLFWELLHPVHKQVIDAMTRNKKEKDFDGATTFFMNYIICIFRSNRRLTIHHSLSRTQKSCCAPDRTRIGLTVRASDPGIWMDRSLNLVHSPFNFTHSVEQKISGEI